MNRPHVAALLRLVAAQLEVSVVMAEGKNPDIEKELSFLRAEVAPRLRVRAGEIEAGG